MDLSSLKDQVSNLTLYDLKAGVRKVQNGNLLSLCIDSASMLTWAIAAVMNYTEMESKVFMVNWCCRPDWALIELAGPRSHEQ